MIILAKLDRETLDIISYEVVDDIPVTYNYANYYQRGYVFDSENQLNKSQGKIYYYYFNIEVFVSYHINLDLQTMPISVPLANKLLKILRKEKLKTIEC